MGCTSSSAANEAVATFSKQGRTTSEVSEGSQDLTDISGQSFDGETTRNSGISQRHLLLVNQFLEENALFKRVASRRKAKALNYLQPMVFGHDEVIAERMSSSDKAFLVVSGEVRLVRSGENTQVVKKNGIFSEISFYFRTRRTFKAVAGGETLLLALSYDTFSQHYKNPLLSGMVNFIEVTSQHRVAVELQKVDLFRDFSMERLQQVAKGFHVKVVEKGDTLISEGDTKDSSFYVLGEGEMVVTLHSKRGLEILELKTLRAGASFGEISLLESRTRTASITAMSDSTLFVLSKTNFERFLYSNPDIHKQMMTTIRERADMMELSTNIPFVRSLKPNKLHLFAAACVPCTFAPNEVIFIQGSKSPQMFYILSRGSVDVFINNSKIKSLDQKGSYFGEISLVVDKPHSATVTASSCGARCLACSKEDFESIFNDEPAVFAEISLKVLGKNSELKHVLHHPAGREAFLEHCQTEFASENVSFFVQAEDIERMGTHQVRKSVLEVLGHNVDDVVRERYEDLKIKTRNVFDRFVDPDGPEPINIKSRTREEISRQIEGGEYSYEIFSKAKEAIYSLLEKDNFSRFQASKAFENLLLKLGAYDDTSSRTSLSRKLEHLSQRQKQKSITAHRLSTIQLNDVQRIRDQIV